MVGGRDAKPAPPALAVLVLQSLLDYFSAAWIQQRNLLVARMQITTYNHHVLGSFRPSLGRVQLPSLLGHGSRHRHLISPTDSSKRWIDDSD